MATPKEEHRAEREGEKKKKKRKEKKEEIEREEHVTNRARSVALDLYLRARIEINDVSCFFSYICPSRSVRVRARNALFSASRPSSRKLSYSAEANCVVTRQTRNPGTALSRHAPNFRYRNGERSDAPTAALIARVLPCQKEYRETFVRHATISLLVLKVIRKPSRGSLFGLDGNVVKV